MQSRRFYLSAALLAGLVVGSMGCEAPPSDITGGAGGMGGAGGAGGSACVPEDDKNECTDDVCNAEGTTTHNPKPAGTACSSGSSQCDGNGQCVECFVADDCPGMDDACQTRTCTNGACGTDFAATGTPLPTQTAGDCKIAVCDGNGATIQNDDDTDILDDSNACTADACAGGMPSNTNLPPGTNCGTSGSGEALVCDAMGQCVGCNVATDCPGTDDECSKRTCTANVCGVEFTAKDTPVAAQTPNDCLKHVCDGAGNAVDIADDADVPLDDGNTCTLEACAGGMPMHPNAANGSTCNDGNACTQSDTCQMGACTGANPVTCAASDQCHDAGTCNPMTGLCSNPAKPNGTTCNDNNACTQSDTCQAGSCTGGNSITCTASDQCHDAGTCDPMTGVCSNPAKPNGATCNDGNACTQSDTCQAGSCTGGNSITCTASDQCHDAGTCNPMTGLCSNPAKPNGTTCSDNNACTLSDTCQAGTCTGANPITCTASDQCHDPGTCNPATGMCSDPAKPNGVICNDNNACTQTDSCQAGTCTGTNPIVCMASDQCHIAGTCNTMTGMCSNPNAPNGTMCTLNGSGGICSVGVCTLCGNGTINAGEQCDDGNTVGGDGCGATCLLEETENNNTCMLADTIFLSGTPRTGSITGAITPVGDQDWYSFSVPGPNPRSVRIETFIGGTGMCTATTGSSDTEISLYAPNCTTLLGSDDEDGINSCSLIDPTNDPFARNLAPGNYHLKVNRFNNLAVINQYQVVVTIVGTCGNSAVEPGETCDDGNLATGDGCNATCSIESGYTCTGSPSVCFPPEINCNDGLDNNGNGTTDNADASCALPAYFTPCSAGQRLLVYPASGPTPIPGTPGMSSNINVTGATQIARAAFLFNITHPYVSDLDMYLVPPGGPSRDVCTGNGTFADNFTNTLLDSTCATSITTIMPTSAPFSACYAPETSLAPLIGTSANGLWSLNVLDRFTASDDGTFNSWKLILCTTP